MNSNVRSLRAFCALFCLALLAVSASAQTTNANRYRSSPLGNKVRIDGDANIHKWFMNGDLIGGYLEVPAGVVLDPAQSAQPGVSGGKLNAHAEVSIPVTSMASGTEGMDEAMQDAMKAPAFPRIQYHLTDMTLKEPHAAGTPLEFDTKGDLAIAGVTNKISMPIRIEAADKPKLKVVGSIQLKMTDFKITPPNKLGVFKCTNEVTVSFEWLITPPKPADGKNP